MKLTHLKVRALSSFYLYEHPWMFKTSACFSAQYFLSTYLLFDTFRPFQSLGKRKKNAETSFSSTMGLFLLNFFGD